MTQTASPAIPSLPSFIDVPRPEPRVKQALPNPYDAVVKALAQSADVRGYSGGKQFTMAEAQAKVHQNMIRRAAKKQGVGISVLASPVNSSGTVTVTFAVVPKRVVNRATNTVEAPEQGANDTLPASDEQTEQPAKVVPSVQEYQDAQPAKAAPAKRNR